MASPMSVAASGRASAIAASIHARSPGATSAYVEVVRSWRRRRGAVMDSRPAEERRRAGEGGGERGRRAICPFIGAHGLIWAGRCGVPGGSAGYAVGT